MKRAPKTAINAVASGFQVVVSSIVLFVTYAQLVSSVGVEAVGAWALILAWLAVGKVVESGCTVGLLVSLPRYRNEEGKGGTKELVGTGFATISVMGAAAVLSIASVLWWISYEEKAGFGQYFSRDVLIVAALSVWILGVGNVLLATLDAWQKVILRVVIVLVSQVIFCLCAIWWTRTNGLLGFGYAYIVQGLFMVVAAWTTVTIQLQMGLVFPIWRRQRFIEIAKAGAAAQISGLVGLFFEPTTRFLIGGIGGIAMVGYVDMASQAVTRLRQLFVSAAQVVVPKFSIAHKTSNQDVKDLYIQVFRRFVLVVTPPFFFLFAIFPAIGYLWLGHFSQEFSIYGAIIWAGWFVNLLNVPAYYAFIGAGSARWNIISHVTLGILNITLGLILGLKFGVVGVVIGAASALVFASIMTLVAFHRIFSIEWREMWCDRIRYVLLLLVPIGSTSFLLCLNWLSGSPPESSVVMYIFAVAAVVLGAIYGTRAWHEIM